MCARVCVGFSADRSLAIEDIISDISGSSALDWDPKFPTQCMSVGNCATCVFMFCHTDPLVKAAAGGL